MTHNELFTAALLAIGPPDDITDRRVIADFWHVAEFYSFAIAAGVVPILPDFSYAEWSRWYCTQKP